MVVGDHWDESIEKVNVIDCRYLAKKSTSGRFTLITDTLIII